ncbi:MAG: hypothetical protein GY853_13280 [PVC group bacterium]|nr:hypothetical protein [PVC group bacterium]
MKKIKFRKYEQLPQYQKPLVSGWIPHARFLNIAAKDLPGYKYYILRDKHKKGSILFYCYDFMFEICKYIEEKKYARKTI